MSGDLPSINWLLLHLEHVRQEHYLTISTYGRAAVSRRSPCFERAPSQEDEALHDLYLCLLHWYSSFLIDDGDDNVAHDGQLISCFETILNAISQSEYFSPMTIHVLTILMLWIDELQSKGYLSEKDKVVNKLLGKIIISFRNTAQKYETSELGNVVVNLFVLVFHPESLSNNIRHSILLTKLCERFLLINQRSVQDSIPLQISGLTKRDGTFLEELLSINSKHDSSVMVTWFTQDSSHLLHQPMNEMLLFIISVSVMAELSSDSPLQMLTICTNSLNTQFLVPLENSVVSSQSVQSVVAILHVISTLASRALTLSSNVSLSTLDQVIQSTLLLAQMVDRSIVIATSWAKSNDQLGLRLHGARLKEDIKSALSTSQMENHSDSGHIYLALLAELPTVSIGYSDKNIDPFVENNHKTLHRLIVSTMQSSHQIIELLKEQTKDLSSERGKLLDIT